MLRAVLVAMILVLPLPAAGQQAGWHYSPYDGEGDRAAMGCGYGADPEKFTCLVVRCEDDFTVGLHIHTSRPGGDNGRWRLDVDRDSFEVEAVADSSPYNARVAGDTTALLDAIRHGAVAYLDPLSGPPAERNGISLDGSLYAINQALYFCAPAVPEGADEADKKPRAD